jgi:DNA-binding NarL/FixJ family response regulator
MHLNSLNQKFNKKSKNSSIYVLNEEQSPLKSELTPRQQDCLFLIIHGKSIKEIGLALGISPRTVEVHVADIKSKLNCNTRSQIIEKSISMGFLNYIPKTIADKKIKF